VDRSGNAVAVPGPWRQRAKDEQVQRSLHEW
jgi:hypothetical protein